MLTGNPHRPCDTIDAPWINESVRAHDLDHAAWQRAPAIHLTRYWSGAEAPAIRHAEARLIWSDEALGVRFVCRQEEPLVVSEHPQLAQKSLGLWERDVCEIFIAPDARASGRYFEFEAAPTGEWIDLAINRQPDGRRETDWEFSSGMTAAARVAQGWVTIALRVPFASLTAPAGAGGAPPPGARWRVNLFRCVGAGPNRGYLAWQPTHTAQPDFHVPEKFGWLNFQSSE